MLRPRLLLLATLAIPQLAFAQSPSAPADTPPPVFEVLGALPQDTDGTLNIEAVFLIKDLHRLSEISDTVRKRFERFAVAKEYFSSEHQKNVLGFDMYTELPRLAELSTPSGKPSSAALAVYSNKGQFGVQFILRAEAGFLDRVKKAMASPNPPPWTATIDGSSITIPIMDGFNLVGQVDESGWLRLAPDASMLIGAQGGTAPTLYSDKMAPYVERNDMVLLLRPGLGTEMLGGFMADPMAMGVVQTLKGVGIGIEYDGDKSQGVSLILESSMLQQYGPLARKADLQNWFVPMLDSHATSVFSISLPPALVGIGSEIARTTPLGEIPGGDGFANLLGQIDGRLGFMTFDSPGDWALAMRFNTAEAAAAFAPALQKLIDGGLKALGVEEQDFAILEEFAGANALHFKPDALLDGWRVVAIDANVVMVPKTGRFDRLMALKNAPADQKKKAEVTSFVAGPLTPMVKRTVEQPAIALGYTLMAGDGAIFDYLIVPSKAISMGVDAMLKGIGDADPAAQGIAQLSTLGLKRLPLTFAVGMVGWLMTYDLALAIDVRGDILLFEITSSTI
ncbi:MAG: hypothetical protein AAF658_06405 [Myxococcota bacterium]